MTALTVTKANVVWYGGTAPLRDQVAGEAFDAGDMVYLSDAGTWLKAQCDGTAVEAGANNIAMALATADAAGARVSLAPPGAVVTIGTGAAGVVYCIGTTAGDLVPVADLASTNKVTVAAIFDGGSSGSSRVKIVHGYSAGSVLA